MNQTLNILPSVDVQYQQLVAHILSEGTSRKDRTGVGTRSVFGYALTFDLRRGFPLLALKETRWKVAFLEMLFFLRGETNVQWLNDHGCKLWDAWADENGDLGPIYGAQWRDWGQSGDNRYDQIAKVIHQIKTNPTGRRHLVTAWNVAELDDMALPPCHWAHQLYADGDEWLDLMLYIRSSDVALGLPFNIAQYALLLHLYARATGRKARMLHVTLGDVHIYENHVEAMMALRRASANAQNDPQIEFLTENTDIDGYHPEDFNITGYVPGPFVKLPVAV